MTHGSTIVVYSRSAALHRVCAVGEGDMTMYDAPQGWQCPVCKRVYSPNTTMCLFCGNTDTITTTGTCWIGDTPETMKQPTTGGKCSCWHENDYGMERCWGTKERDVCDCGGDKRKCNFNLYPEKGT